MRNVTVSTTFDGRFWILLVHELGVISQSLRREDVRSTARELTAAWLDVPLHTIHVGRVRYKRVHWSALVP